MVKSYEGYCKDGDYYKGCSCKGFFIQWYFLGFRVILGPVLAPGNVVLTGFLWALEGLYDYMIRPSLGAFQVAGGLQGNSKCYAQGY